MKDDRKRIVLVGASGVFGQRLAAMIARWPDVVLVLAARDLARLEAVATELATTRPAAKIEVAQLDRLNPKGLAALGAWAVVDAAGPFQGQDHAFPARCWRPAPTMSTWPTPATSWPASRRRSTGRLAPSGAGRSPAPARRPPSATPPSTP
jgi:hypothetical protein